MRKKEAAKEPCQTDGIFLQVWKRTGGTVNQLHVARQDVMVTARDLLKLPEASHLFPLT